MLTVFLSCFVGYLFDDKPIPDRFEATPATRTIYISLIGTNTEGQYKHSLIQRVGTAIIEIEPYLSCKQVPLELEITPTQEAVLQKVINQGHDLYQLMQDKPILRYDKQLQIDTREAMVKQLNEAFIESQVKRFYELKQWYDFRRLGVLHFLAQHTDDRELIAQLLPWHKQLQQQFSGRQEQDYQRLIDQLLLPLSENQRKKINSDQWLIGNGGLEVLILSLQQARKRVAENSEGNTSLIEMALLGGVYHKLGFDGTWRHGYRNTKSMRDTSIVASRLLKESKLDVPKELHEELAFLTLEQRRKRSEIYARAATIDLNIDSEAARSFLHEQRQELQNEFDKKVQELLSLPEYSLILELLAEQNERQLGFILSLVESKSIRKRYEISDQQLRLILSKSKLISEQAKAILLQYEAEIVQQMLEELHPCNIDFPSFVTHAPRHGFPSLTVLLSDSQQWQEMLMTDKEKQFRAIKRSEAPDRIKRSGK